MSDLSRNTGSFTVQKDPGDVGEVLEAVCEALVERGYNPVNQIVGYVMSGDPTYITSYGGARTKIARVERDEILEELVRVYIEHMDARRR